MGGDHAPGEIVAGALDCRRRARHARRCCYGQVEAILEHVPGGVAARPTSRSSTAATWSPMDDEPAAAVRRKKDASVVRCAQAVREGAPK